MHNREIEKKHIWFYDLFKEQTFYYDCKFMTILMELTSRNFELPYIYIYYIQKITCFRFTYK